MTQPLRDGKGPSDIILKSNGMEGAVMPASMPKNIEKIDEA
jgi:hypothetical protein